MKNNLTDPYGMAAAMRLAETLREHDQYVYDFFSAVRAAYHSSIWHFGFVQNETRSPKC